MKTITALGPEHEAIDDQWSEFFNKYGKEMPMSSTSLTLGAVFLTLLDMYKPPVEEIVPVTMSTLVAYNKTQDYDGYLN